jgi:hypothetical protein
MDVENALAIEADIKKLRATAAKIRRCLMTWVSPLVPRIAPRRFSNV